MSFHTHTFAVRIIVCPMSRRFAILFLVALSLGLYVGNASAPALVDEADCAHAIAAREMRESGDWAVLHINGIRYLEKAPVHYWLVAASYKLFGENDFATRLPLALATVGLVLLVYVFGRRFFGERAGFYSGLVMCTSIGTFLYTRTMIPEAIYALEFTAAFYLFLRAWQGTIDWRVGYWGAAAMVALATLTRGLVGVIFPVVVLALFFLWIIGWRRWRELPLVSSTLVFLAVALPWHIVVGRRSPGFYWFYFMNEHVLRAIGARYPQDSATVPLALWWVAHLAWFFPWSFFLPLALGSRLHLRQPEPTQRWAKKTTSATDTSPLARACPELVEGSSEAWLLLLIWAGFILLFFSFTRRLEYYSFGAWPAIAILLGLGVARAEEGRHRWLSRLQGALAIVGVLMAAGLGTLLWISRNVRAVGDISNLLETKRAEFYKVAMASSFDLTPQAFAALRIPAGAAALSLLVGLGVAWILRHRNRGLAATVVMALGAAGFLFATNDAYRIFEPHLSSRALATEIAKHLRRDDQILLYGDFYNGCTVGFYTHRKTWIWNGRYNALEYGSYYPDAPKIFLTDQDFAAFWKGPHRVFLVVPELHRRAALLRLLPDSTYLLASSGGRQVFVNQPLTPGQPTLAQLRNSPATPTD